MIAVAESLGGKWLGSVPEAATLFTEVKKLRHVSEDFIKTTELLKGDFLKAGARLNRQPKSQFNRRVLIKTIFSFFEGQAYLMKQVALHRHAHLEIAFSDADLAFMREEKYHMDENGDAHFSRTNYPKVIPNYQFAFKCFAKAHGGSTQFDKQAVKDLGRLEAVRNRLTHPKASDNLFVTDDELKLAEQVLNWHLKVSADVIGEALKQTSQTIRMADFRGKLTFSATLPFVVVWHDGHVFEFPTKNALRQFVKTLGARRANLDFTTYSLSDLLEKG